jgi:hypothetical protein
MEADKDRASFPYFSFLAPPPRSGELIVRRLRHEFPCRAQKTFNAIGERRFVLIFNYPRAIN